MVDGGFIGSEALEGSFGAAALARCFRPAMWDASEAAVMVMLQLVHVYVGARCGVLCVFLTCCFCFSEALVMRFREWDSLER